MGLVQTTLWYAHGAGFLIQLKSTFNRSKFASCKFSFNYSVSQGSLIIYRCIDHSMHRAAYHFIKVLSIPSWMMTKRNWSKKGAEDDEDEDGGDNSLDNEDEENVDTSLDIDASADNAEAMAETLVVDFKPGDMIGKLLAFVNQVQMSSDDVRDYLAYSCQIHNIKVVELRLWVRSCWGSLTHCLTATLEVQKVPGFDFVCCLLNTNLISQAIDYFCVTADSNDDLPPLKDKVWVDYRLQGPEWKLIRLVHNCLKVSLLLLFFFVVLSIPGCFQLS